MQLSSENIGEYLVKRKLLNREDVAQITIQLILAKNFNLLVTLPDGQKLLVKQERHNQDGKTAGEFQQEWQIQEFLQDFPELDHLRPCLPHILQFDREQSLIVFHYLDEYRDLMDYYMKENHFPTAIASILGKSVATIHRATFNREDYQAFFLPQLDARQEQVSLFIRGLERISPEIFSSVPMDGLKFFVLYQRYDSLGNAIASLGASVSPCCLTHNDLKLNNILLHTNWEHPNDSVVRLIDWERSSWGDPAFDVGTVIASYLQLWLNSLVISTTLSIEESLRLATTPLDQLQPSIAAFTSAYLETFPEILEQRPHYLQQVVQFAGLVLIQQIQAMIQYQKAFGNTGIAMLQVAKSLLCRPEQSIPTVFGTTASELIPTPSFSVKSI
ncbi:MAG: phosphotransferase [Chroococcales cyanobacterium]